MTKIRARKYDFIGIYIKITRKYEVKNGGTLLFRINSILTKQTKNN